MDFLTLGPYRILSEQFLSVKENDSVYHQYIKSEDGNCDCVKWVFGNLEYTLECFDHKALFLG